MRVIPVPCMFDNYSYLVICENTAKAAVVDPSDPFLVTKVVGEQGGELEMILCTHHHQDHTGGVEELLVENPSLAVYGFSGDLRRIAGMTHPLHGGDKLRLGELIGKVIYTPGHTTGSLCYLFENALFTGDTLFGAGCGRLFEGNPEQLYSSVNTQIGELPDDTQIYFGHEYTEQNLKFASQLEPNNNSISQRLMKVQQLRKEQQPSAPSTLIEEKATNPFLRCKKPSLRNNFPGTTPKTPAVEIFTQLRAMRDNY